VNGRRKPLAEKKHLAVLFGGRSGEYEVSLMSASAVLEAIDRELYTVLEVGITQAGEWLAGEGALEAFKNGMANQLFTVSVLPNPAYRGLQRLQADATGNRIELLSRLDVLFPVLHGTFGEDGTIQGLFELANVAYVGAGVLASALGMDKGVFKDVMLSSGIPVVAFDVILRREIEQNPDTAIQKAEAVGPYPLFVKPANLGSSVGVTKCQTRSDLLEGLLEAAQFDRRILVEVGLNAREIEISVLGNDDLQVSVPGEIIPGGDFYSYEAKYMDQGSRLLIPAPISQVQTEEIQALAVQAFRAIDGAGLARVDFLLDKKDGKIYLNELNTMPGFTKISMYPKLWQASGLSYKDLISRLIELALERRADREQTIYCYQRDTLR
jgi:D-alanine-D-alanine ligase